MWEVLLTHILCEKYQEHLVWLALRDSKKFEKLFLAKLKTTITFVPGIRTTIIIYVFGVEKISHILATQQSSVEVSN